MRAQDNLITYNTYLSDIRTKLIQANFQTNTYIQIKFPAYLAGNNYKETLSNLLEYFFGYVNNWLWSLTFFDYEARLAAEIRSDDLKNISFNFLVTSEHDFSDLAKYWNTILSEKYNIRGDSLVRIIKYKKPKWTAWFIKYSLRQEFGIAAFKLCDDISFNLSDTELLGAAKTITQKLVDRLELEQVTYIKQGINTATTTLSKALSPEADGFADYLVKMSTLKKIIESQQADDWREQCKELFIKDLSAFRDLLISKKFIKKHQAHLTNEIINYLLMVEVVNAEDFFDSLCEEFLFLTASYYGPKCPISNFTLTERFALSFLSILESLRNRTQFPTKKNDVETVPFSPTGTANIDLKGKRLKLRMQLYKERNFFTAILGMPFFKLFSEFYQDTVELIADKGLERHNVFFLVKKAVSKRNKGGNLVITRLTEETLESFLARKSETHVVDLTEDAFLKIQNVKLDIFLVAPKAWESGIEGTENYTGIYPGNSQDLLYPLVNPHWSNEHVFIPSKVYITVLNKLSQTPYYLNEEQFAFTYTEENPDFVTYNEFIDLKKTLALLWKDKEKLSAENNLDFLILQKKIARYYDQELYSNAIKHAKARFDQTYAQITSDLNPELAEKIKPTIQYYFPSGCDFRGRLTSKLRVHPINSSKFRKCLSGVYSGLQSKETIERVSSSTSKQLHKTINFPHLNNIEFISMDAVSSGIQHAQLFLGNGEYRDSLYFTQYTDKTFYALINDFIIQEINNSAASLKFNTYGKKYKQQKKALKNFHFAVQSNLYREPDELGKKPKKPRKFFEKTKSYLITKNNKKYYVNSFYAPPNAVTGILSDIELYDEEFIKTYKKGSFPKWAILPLSYGASQMGIEKHIKNRLAAKGISIMSTELAALVAEVFFSNLKKGTSITTLFDAFSLFRKTALKNYGLKDIQIPSLLGNTIIPKYRTMKTKRIARRVSLLKSKLSYKHRIKIPCSERKYDYEKSQTAFYANVIQSLDVTVLILTTLYFLRFMRKDYPFPALWVHDSVSMHSMFESSLLSAFVQSHYDLYATSQSSKFPKLKLSETSQPLYKSFIESFKAQIPADKHDQKLTDLLNAFEKLIVDASVKSPINWDDFLKNARLMKHEI